MFRTQLKLSERVARSKAPAYKGKYSHVRRFGPAPHTVWMRLVTVLLVVAMRGRSSGEHGAGARLVEAWELQRALTRSALTVAAVLALLGLLYTVSPIVLLFLFAIILALALNAPVSWVESKGAPRWFATFVVLFSISAVLIGLGYLALPRVSQQAAQIVEDLPTYGAELGDRVSAWLTDNPAVEEHLGEGGDLVRRALPSAGTLLSRVGRYTLGAVLGVVFVVVLLAAVIYIVVSPRPLIEGYLGAFPERLRERAANALRHSSDMVVGWMWSSIVVGTVEGVAAALFLWWLGIPGALLWGVLTFFAEVVPRVGPFIFQVPPVLIAFAISPLDGLWVLLFFLALNEITADTVAPAVRGKVMQLHPISLLVMASAFGLWGALVATPVAGIIKAFYDEFRRPPSSHELAGYVDQVLSREKVEGA